jgi:hypothetical protein
MRRGPCKLQVKPNSQQHQYISLVINVCENAQITCSKTYWHLTVVSVQPTLMQGSIEIHSSGWWIAMNAIAIPTEPTCMLFPLTRTEALLS